MFWYHYPYYLHGRALLSGFAKRVCLAQEDSIEAKASTDWTTRKRDDEDRMSDCYTPSTHSEDDLQWIPPLHQRRNTENVVAELEIIDAARALLRSSTSEGDIFAFGFLVVEVR